MIGYWIVRDEPTQKYEAKFVEMPNPRSLDSSKWDRMDQIFKSQCYEVVSSGEIQEEIGQKEKVARITKAISNLAGNANREGIFNPRGLEEIEGILRHQTSIATIKNGRYDESGEVMR